MSDNYKVEIEALTCNHRQVIYHYVRANGMQEAIDSAMEKSIMGHYTWSGGEVIEFIPLAVRRYVKK